MDFPCHLNIVHQFVCDLGFHNIENKAAVFKKEDEILALPVQQQNHNDPKQL